MFFFEPWIKNPFKSLHSMVGSCRDTYQQSSKLSIEQIRPLVNHETYLHYLEWQIAKLDSINGKKTVERRRAGEHRDRIWLKGVAHIVIFVISPKDII